MRKTHRPPTVARILTEFAALVLLLARLWLLATRTEKNIPVPQTGADARRPTGE